MLHDAVALWPDWHQHRPLIRLRDGLERFFASQVNALLGLPLLNLACLVELVVLLRLHLAPALINMNLVASKWTKVCLAVVLVG